MFQLKITSIVVSVDGQVPKNLIDKGWWVKPNSTSSYSDDGSAMPYVVVSLRSGEASCSTSTLPETMGDRIVVNADTLGVASSGTGSVRGVNWTMPLVRTDALVDKFHVAGACVKKMGRHFPIDVSSVEQIRAGKRTTPKMTWDFANLAPVVPMYDDFSGKINAIFVTSPDVQQSLFSSRGWDKVPLVSFLMCKNWCDEACTFDETFLSTMHLFFRNYTTYDCKGPCQTLNCCPANEALRPDSDGFTAANPMTSLSSASTVTSIAGAVVAFAMALTLSQ
jgi:hypothetical protein